MKDYKQIIHELSDDQTKEILSIAVKSIRKNNIDEIPISEYKNLQIDLLYVLAKPMLFALTEGEDEVACLLQLQLIENENFLVRQRNQGKNRGISVSMLLLLAVTIPFIEAKFEIKIGGKDQKIHFAARIKSLQEVIPAFNKSKLEPIFANETPTTSTSSSVQLKKEINKLIIQGKTSNVIDELMSYFENTDEDSYGELLTFSGRLEKLNKQKRMHTISHENFELESNRITAGLLEYVQKVK